MILCIISECKDSVFYWNQQIIAEFFINAMDDPVHNGTQAKIPTFPLSHFGHLGFWKWKDGKVKVQKVNLKLYYYIYYI